MNNSSKKQSISSSGKSKTKKNNWQYDSSTKSNFTKDASFKMDQPSLTKGQSLKFHGKNREESVVVEIEDQDDEQEQSDDKMM